MSEEVKDREGSCAKCQFWSKKDDPSAAQGHCENPDTGMGLVWCFDSCPLFRKKFDPKAYSGAPFPYFP